MNEQRDTVELALANRRFLYRLAARCFAEEADQELVDLLTSDHTLQEALLIPPADDVEEQLNRLHTLLRELGDNAVEQLRCEYARVFLGPGTLPSPPWESVHITGKNLLFQPQTLSVREAYRSAGFLPMRYPAVADDHIALEFDFLANLAESACEAFASGDEVGLRRCLEEHRSFLDDHLLVWLREYCDELAMDSPQGMYTLIATLAFALVERDRHLLNELLAHSMVQ